MAFTAQQVLKKIRKDEIANLLYLYGEEKVLQKEIVKQVKRRVLDPKYDDLGYASISGKDASTTDIYGYLKTAPLLSVHKVLVITNFDELLKNSNKRDFLETLLDTIPATTYVILWGEKRPDKRLRLTKKAQKLGWLINCSEPNKRDLRTWIYQRVKNDGSLISREAVELLLEKTGASFEAIRAEIEKLMLFTNNNQIHVDAVEAIVIPTLEASIFTYVDALSNRKVQRGWESLVLMLQQGEPPLRIFAMIVRQYRLMILTKVLLSQGKDSHQIQRELGVPNFVVKKLSYQVRNFSHSGLEKGLNSLQRLEGEIKSGKIDSVYALEVFTLSADVQL